MSGKILSRVSALSLVMLLAACGGDGDSTPLVDAGGNGGNSSPGNAEGDDTTENPEPEAPSDSTLPESINQILGTGVGQSFTAGSMDIQKSPLQVMEQTNISLNIVDSDSKALSIGSGSSIKFTSACLDSGRSTIQAPATVNSGEVLAAYESI
jgi:hypothetical protein